jgi:hypothetical protein
VKTTVLRTKTFRAGEVEISFRPSDRSQVALKLKTSDDHFALIKTGQMPEWLKNELGRFNVNQSYEDEGYFERLNDKESQINILMGSRSFYEGWDSNRPNVANFINIGVGTEAQKFVLQAVGRGCRIQPLKDKRQRLATLLNSGLKLPDGLFEQVRDYVEPLETLYIFGTNRDALHQVIEGLEKAGLRDEWQTLDLFRLNEDALRHELLIPVYRKAAATVAEQKNPPKFEIAASELALLKSYVDYVGDDRVLVARHDTQPKMVALLHHGLADEDTFFDQQGQQYKNLEVLTRRVLGHFSAVPEEFDRLKALEDEIRHYKSIEVSFKDISEVTEAIEQVRDYRDPEALRGGLLDQYERKELTRAQYQKALADVGDPKPERHLADKQLRIERIANHYYLPLVMTDNEKVEHIRHVIRYASEVRFIGDLTKYLDGKNRFGEFDWWLFSKLDESLDSVYIPWFDQQTNQTREFKPDFIFWLQKGRDYHVVFVDPKGTEHVGAYHKLNGYRAVFEIDEKPRVIPFGKERVRVSVALYTDDKKNVLPDYQRHWVGSVDAMLKSVLSA